MARDQACKWKPGFYQFLSNFLVTRRGGFMHPPIPFSSQEPEPPNLRYPVGQAGWARTCGAVETLHERPIFSVHTKEFVQIVSPTDEHFKDKEDCLSVGVDTGEMDRIRRDEVTQKHLMKKESADVSTVLEEGEPISASVDASFDPVRLANELREESAGISTGGVPMEQFSAFQFGRNALLIIFDAMNSAFSGAGESAVLISDDEWDATFAKYRRLFSLGAATYQKRIYVYSPKGEFWKIQQPSVFNEWRENLARLARQTGWIAVNGEPLLSTLDDFRHRDNWHFATNRGTDWGLAAQFQKILTLIMAIGRFVCVDDPMMRALASCPLRDLPLPNQTAQLYLSGVARFATPIQPASVNERFEATPFALSLLLEEAVCFISPAQCKILNGAVAKQGRYAGKCWVALDVRQLVGSMPRWRFQRYAWHARSASFGTGFVHSTPKVLTAEMMEEVMFNIGPLAKKTSTSPSGTSPRGCCHFTILPSQTWF